VHSSRCYYGDISLTTPLFFRRVCTGSTVYALDMGCAVGGTAFELTRHFDQVLGVDFSQAFVDAANFMKVWPCVCVCVCVFVHSPLNGRRHSLTVSPSVPPSPQEKRSVNISIQTEGTLMQEKQVFLPSGIHPERARFM
jgi:hypothetical protein